MADELTKKTTVRRGQRQLAERRLAEVDTVTIDIEAGGEPDRVKLAQLKLGLEEKLETLKRLDEEIVSLTEIEADVITEIPEADTYSQETYERLVKVEYYL